MSERPSKRVRLLDESDSSSESGSDSDSSSNQPLKVNEDYARRFEHNKKREELHRLQDKYGQKHTSNGAKESDSDSDSSSEEEDEGELATAEVDQEIAGVLQALKSKDPRLYDKDHKWFKDYDPTLQTTAPQSKEKSINLRDYHRANLMSQANETNSITQDEEKDVPTQTYDEEQAALKQGLISAAAEQASDSDEDDEDDELMVPKAGQKLESRPVQQQVSLQDADTNPDKFLMEYVTSRAWADMDKPSYKPFDDEDDSDEDAQADAFEAAYNLRFEDPSKSNETLTSHSRKAALAQSARREEPNKRQRARQRDQERRDAEKAEEKQEKARLRQLKLEEAQRKLDQFKKVAGIRGRGIAEDDFRKFLKADFDDEKWEEEMAKRFDEDYYAEKERRDSDEEDQEDAKPSKKKKAKKPKFDDDVDIADLVPDFETGDDDGGFTLTDDEEVADVEQDTEDGGVTIGNGDGDEVERAAFTAAPSSKRKDHAKDRADRKRQARKQRMKLEELVDQQMASEAPSTTKKGPLFRYRETSPTAFGMSAHEILMADDKQLNEFVGLKKLAAFRDEARKAQDKKRLKKHKLLEWRRETFGDREGPKVSFEDYINQKRMNGDVDVDFSMEGIIGGERGGHEGSKKRRRAKKRIIKETGIV